MIKKIDGWYCTRCGAPCVSSQSWWCEKLGPYQADGGSINASTSVDWTNYMTIAPRDTLVPLLRIEALRLKNGVANN